MTNHSKSASYASASLSSASLSSASSQSSRFEQYAAEYHRLLNPPVPTSIPFTTQQENKMEDMDAVLQRQLMARRIDEAKWAPQIANGTTPTSVSASSQLAITNSTQSSSSSSFKPPRLCITDDDDLPASSIIILSTDQDIGLTRKHITWAK
jgi:hypothetical protein